MSDVKAVVDEKVKIYASNEFHVGVKEIHNSDIQLMRFVDDQGN